MPAKQIGFDSIFESRVTFLSLKPGESARVSFIENVPGMESSVTQFAQHWISEKKDGNYIMCNKGRCCEIYTWDDRNKDYVLSKPRTVFWVPVVLYYPDPETMEPTCGVAILTLNSFQFGRLVEQVKSVEAGTLPFFSRDCTVSYDKNGQYNDYAFLKGEKRAVWQENPKMKAIIEEQLQTLAEDINASLPPEYSEEDLNKLIDEWDKTKAARAHASQSGFQQAQAAQAAFLQQNQSTAPQQVPPAYAQPQVPPSLQAQQAAQAAQVANPLPTAAPVVTPQVSTIESAQPVVEATQPQSAGDINVSLTELANVLQQNAQ